MKQGWIRIHRSIEDWDLYLSEPFTYTQAWIDLILIANHKDGTIVKRGNIVTVKRGQVGWSERTIASRWQWSRGKLRRYLELLQNRGQIVPQKNNVLGLITIVKYNEYQEDSTTDSTTERPQKDHRQYHNKNDNNEKNEKKQADFQILWTNYPRKTNKQSAVTAFKKVAVDVSVLIAAVEEQKKSEQWQEQRYIPHLATWLNQKRWGDQMPVMDQDSLYKLEMEKLGVPQFQSKYGDDLAMAYAKYSKI